MKINRSKVAFIAKVLIVLTLIWLIGSPSPAAGAPASQEEEPAAGDDWSVPLNLSRSGAAAAPQLLAVDDGYLVLWQDAAEGFVYTIYRHGIVTGPSKAELPFATRSYFPDLPPISSTPLFSPYLVAGGATGTPGSVVHALWIDDQSETGENVLWYSKVSAASFGNFAAWAERQQLAEGVVQMAAAVDETGRLHVAYLQGAGDPESPAGLYARYTSTGTSWSEPKQIYTSAYYRQLDETTANVQVAAAGSSLLAAWDDWPRGRVLLARSTNNGQSWLEAEEIDRRLANDGDSSIDPRMVRVFAQGDALHLTWQASHNAGSCTQYSRRSDDGGQSWEEVGLEMAAGMNGCPQNVEFLGTGSGLLLLASVPSGTFIYAWDAGRWSEPALQVPLSGFIDEETFRSIAPDCGQDAAVSSDRLVIVTCGRRDIWLLNRALAAIHEAIVAPLWRPPTTLGELTAGDGTAAAILSPVLVNGTGGRYHAFWSQAPLDGEPGFPSIGNEIYYAVWDGVSWSQPVLLARPLGQKATQPAALAASGRLLVFWSGGNAGEVYFRWAAEERAAMALEWSEPALLPAPRPAGSAPDVAVDTRSGDLHAVYAIPFNEDRGIYFVRSRDGGETWSEARKVFDAAAAGWDRVDRPRLAAGNTGQLHLIFEKRSLPENVFASELYYTRSSGNGLTWTEPARVDNGTSQAGEVVWSDLVAVSEWIVHRVWKEYDGDLSYLWAQTSTDGGTSWSQAVHLGGSAGRPGPAALVTDTSGQIFLLSIEGADTAGAERVALKQWQWLDNDYRWEPMEALELTGNSTCMRPSEIAATISATGTGDELAANELVVLLSSYQDEPLAPCLLVTGRQLAPPQPLPTSQPMVTPTPRPTTPPTATPQLQATATPLFPKGPDGSQFGLDILPDPGSGMLVLGAILALVPTALIISLVVVVYSRYRPGRS